MIDVTKKDSQLELDQAAALCGVHVGTVKRWCRSGLLESAKIGRKRVTSLEAVQNYSLRCTAAPVVKVESKKEVAEREAMVRKELKDRFGITF